MKMLEKNSDILASIFHRSVIMDLNFDRKLTPFFLCIALIKFKTSPGVFFRFCRSARTIGKVQPVTGFKLNCSFLKGKRR